MRFSKIAVAAATAASVEAATTTSAPAAARPTDVPICDYYANALLKGNSAQNQSTLLTLLVNTVVIGNYTQPNMNAVPGILAPGKVNDTEVNLLPYFNGELASTNRNNKAVSVNFLDGGAAEPLKKNMPANDNKSRQYRLLTHLYSFFGIALGCTKVGQAGFAGYDGDASMYEVHKFMDLSYAEVTYFITQVALAAQSFGVAQDDITAVGGVLNSLFNVRCAPKTDAVPALKNDLQSICVKDDCPLAKDSDCKLYTDKLAEPSTVSPMGTPTPTSGSGSQSTGAAAPTTSGGSGGSAPSSTSTGAAMQTAVNFAAVIAGVAALAL